MSFRANTKRFQHKYVYLRNGFRDRLLCFVNAVLLFWSLCDPTWLFALNKWLIYLIDMTQKSIKQVKSSIYLGISNIADEGLYKHRSYEWKRHLYLETISEQMQNKNISQELQNKSTNVPNEMHLQNKKLKIPQTVTLLYVFIFLFEKANINL